MVVYLHPFLDLALDEGLWSTLHLHLGQVLQVPIEWVFWDSKPVWMLWQWRKVPSARNQTVVCQFLSMQPRKYANCTFLISIFEWYDTMQSWWAGVTPIVSCADWFIPLNVQHFVTFCCLAVLSELLHAKWEYVDVVLLLPTRHAYLVHGLLMFHITKDLLIVLMSSTKSYSAQCAIRVCHKKVKFTL